MRLRIMLGILVVLGAVSAALWLRFTAPAKEVASDVDSENVNTNAAIENVNAANTNASNVNTEPAPVNQNSTPPTPAPEPPKPSDVVYPIDSFSTRITKKPFGILINPATSPVQPERFSGYHTAADAEVPGKETESPIPIFAMADGKVVVKRNVSGYGGVVMIEHTVAGETVTALYGHVRLSSVSKNVGDTVTKGQQIALLGSGYTAETDYERQHLHFGLLKGSSTNLRGYVASQSQLGPWYDPVKWLSDHNASEPG